MSPAAFALLNLGLYVTLLIVVIVAERRGRRWTIRWHRNVRTRHISTADVLRMIDKATKK